MALRPPRDDLYRELGVSRDATGEELNAAFRARAKALHPDARPDDPVAHERFKRVSLAYSVLSDPAQRARYDDGVLFAEPDELTTRRSTAPPASPPPPPSRWRLSRRGARWAVGGGIVLMVLGVVAAVWVVQLQRDDAALLAGGMAAQAVVVDVGGDRRLEFTTRTGETVQAQESTKSGSAEPSVGDVVRVRYDRDDPSNVVIETSHTARNVTLWIVAVKFLVGGAVLVVLGIRRLGQPDPVAVPAG